MAQTFRFVAKITFVGEGKRIEMQMRKAFREFSGAMRNISRVGTFCEREGLMRQWRLIHDQNEWL